MLKRLEIVGFKSFARKTVLDFSSSVTSIVGPNGSGKSNVAEAFRFALGEQSMKSMRGKRSEDLIWSGSHVTPRSSRAAVVIVFDNTKKIFPKLEFEEVSIERAVFRDGQSEYSINGSKVRLRDVQELLASANVGDTGHHIISQGEADRILVASPIDRRSMLEDALGLKVFEFKKQEAEKKLEKTRDNVKQVEALRKEILPHVKFLQKQVEKLERAEELTRELTSAAQTYFAIEDIYIDRETKKVKQDLATAKEKLEVTRKELSVFEERADGADKGLLFAEEVRKREREIDKLNIDKGTLEREIGRIEGGLSEARKRSGALAQDPYVKVPRNDFRVLKEEIAKHEFPPESSAPELFRSAFISLKKIVDSFFERFGTIHDEYLADEEQAVFALERERNLIADKEREINASIEKTRLALTRARDELASYTESSRERQYRVIELAEGKAREEGNTIRLEARVKELEALYEELKRDKSEVLALAGSAAFSFAPLQEVPDENRNVQEERKRTMERLKIRVEEAGGTGEEVRTEYNDAVNREQFLSRELEDLEKSATGLEELIDDLAEELGKTFAEGLSKVNSSFGEFFALMFGGGNARLTLEDLDEPDEEEEEMEEQKQEKQGIEIAVALPKKKVQSLMQLSGGERALTSIALIFAMSQVNPPPFLILDETDAALDEANSRRYGDMIENLAKKSQLVVITHNRETMSRAGILYGVTMGNDGVSKLLSVKFEEALAVAK